MSDKTYLAILKGGIFASFAILFFVFSSLLFPFISSKQLSFNILIEVLSLFWLFFIIKFPKYLPKKSSLSWGIIAYFVTILMSLAVSVDFNMSFWGDTERMLGAFHLLHFLLFYFIIITAFRSKKDYLQLLNVLVVSSLGVALYGFFKKNPDSSIGNRAYVAVIMLFGLFLQSLFLIKSKEWWVKLLYGVGIVISFVGFIKADISGSQAGLLAGIFTIIFVLSLVSKNKKIKIISIGSLLSFIILIVALFSLRSQPIFDNTYLGKSLRDFSTDNITLNTRLISYRSAGQYLIDNPIDMIFGVGHGNYALIFDKYFSPKFYNYDRGATYFDRAHNNVIDILTTTGIIGLLAYLSIFVFVIIYLIRAYKRNSLDNPVRSIDKIELAILSGLLVAYFVQNLAVFDSFATYLYFMVLLAFIYFIGVKNFEKENVKKIKPIIVNILVPVSALIILLAVINNINSFSMLKDTINAYRDTKTIGIIKSVEAYKKVFAYHTGLERDSRDSFITLFLSSGEELLQSKNRAESEKVINLAVEAVEKNQSYNIYDNLTLYRSSRVYDFIAKYYLNYSDNEKSSHFASLALDTIDRSIESSPGRIPLYLTKANLLLNLDKKQEAVETIEYAKNLNPNLPEAYCQLAHFYFVVSQEDKFFDNFKTCAKMNGLSLVNWTEFLNSVESRYYTAGQLDSLINFYEIVLSSDADNVEILSKAALIYYESGNLEKAKETALKIVAVDESYRAEVETFLEKLNEKNDNKN